MDSQLEEILIACVFTDNDVIFSKELDSGLFGMRELDELLSSESRFRGFGGVIMII